MRGSKHLSEKGAIRVDRQSPWGNPFRLKNERDRDKVILQHRHWILEQCLAQTGTYTHSKLTRLASATALFCWCSPKRCHSENLIMVAMAAIETNEQDFLAWCRDQLAALDA